MANEAATLPTLTIHPGRPAEDLPTLDGALHDDGLRDFPAVPGYSIERELGRGGMGVVYLARQEALGRLVALKMVRSGNTASEDELKRLHQEAAAVAGLQHPNIVQVYEVGRYAGLPYMALEYCPGLGLSKKLGQPLPATEAATLLLTIARAVGAAHAAGIVHRDLKPGNVLFTADGTLKLTDFGLAKKADTSDGLTATGAVLGTPGYMAPEQAAANKQVGRTADVFALGAIFYHMLTGRPPFQGTTALDAIIQTMDSDPVPPSRLVPKLPRDAQTICLKCLEKHPGKRYADAAEVADDLRRFLEGDSISARPLGRAGKAARWCTRHPAVTLLSTAVVALLVATALVSAISYAKLARAQDDLIAERDNAVNLERAAEERAAEAQRQTVMATNAQRAEAQARRDEEAARLKSQRNLEEAIRAREDLAKARADEERERKQAEIHLREALVAQAQAMRFAEKPDRPKAEAALAKAHSLRPGDDVRSEAVRWLDVAHVERVDPVRRNSSADVPFGSDVALGYTRGLTHVLVSSGNGGVQEVNRATGRATRTLQTVPFYGSFMQEFILSRDGRYLVGPLGRSVSGASLQMRDIENNKTMGTLLDERGQPLKGNAADFSHDGTRLAVVQMASTEGGAPQLAVYEVPSLRRLTAWPLPAEGIDLIVRFHPAGELVAVASRYDFLQGSVRLYYASTGRELQFMFDGRPRAIPGNGAIDFSQDGRYLVVGGRSTVQVWDLTRRSYSTETTFPSAPVLGLRTAERDAPARVAAPEEFATHTFAIRGGSSFMASRYAALSPDRRWLAVLRDNKLTLCDMHTGQMLQPLEHVPQVSAGVLRWSDDSRDLMVGLTTYRLRFPAGDSISLRTGLGGPVESVQNLIFGPGERWLAIRAHDDAGILDLTGGPLQVRALRPATGSLNLAGLTTAGDPFTLLGWNRSGQVFRWRLPLPTPVAVGDPHPGRTIEGLLPMADGRTLVVGKERRSRLRIYDLDKEEPLWTVDESQPSMTGVGSLVWDARGRQIGIEAGQQSLARLFDVTTGQFVATARRAGKVMAFRGDRLNVYASERNTGALFDVPEGRRLDLDDQSQAGPPGQRATPTTNSVGFAASPDGRMAIEFRDGDRSNGQDVMAVWELEPPRLLTAIPRARRSEGSSNIRHVAAFSPDRKRFAAALGKGLGVWNVDGGDPVARLDLTPMQFAWHRAPDGQDSIVFLDNTFNVYTWKVDGTSTPRRRFMIAASGIYSESSCTFSADGTRIAYDDGSHIHIRAVPGGETIRKIRRSDAVTYKGVRPHLSPDGQRLATLEVEERPLRWDAGTSAEESPGPNPREPLSPGGKYSIAVVAERHPTSLIPVFGSKSGDRTLGVNDRTSGKRLVSLPAGGSQSSAPRSMERDGGELVQFSGDERVLAYAISGDTVGLYDLERRRALGRISRVGKINLFALDGAGRLLATVGNESKLLALWDVQTGKQLASWPAPTKLTALALSPTGRWLAAGGEGDRVWLRNLDAVRAGLKDFGVNWPEFEPVPAQPPADELAAVLCGAAGDAEAGRATAAMAGFKRAMVLDPANAAEYLLERAAVHLKAFRDQAALVDTLAAVGKASASLRPRVDADMATALSNLALREEWDAIAAAFDAAGLPDDLAMTRHRARLAAWRGDATGYRAACTRLLELREAEKKELDAGDVDAFTLAPGALASFARVENELRQATVNSPNACGPRHDLGVVQFRIGQHEQCIRTLQDALRMCASGSNPKYVPTCRQWYVLAMANQQLGRTEAARLWLDRANTALREHAGSYAWDDRLALQLLRREAEPMFKSDKGGK